MRKSFKCAHKSDEPVSKSKFKTCPPMLTGHRYSESYDSGLAVTVPSLLAAAALTSGGAVAPYLAYTAAMAAGPDRIFDLALVWGTLKARPRLLWGVYSTGEAAARIMRAEAAPSFEKCMVMSDWRP